MASMESMESMHVIPVLTAITITIIRPASLPPVCMHAAPGAAPVMAPALCLPCPAWVCCSVTAKDGGKALCKSIDNKLFQRGQVFIGHPDMKNYTIEADVMSEGNKRKMSDIGLINQRYLIILRGNAREIELSSNLERIKATSPFTLTPNEWHHLKVRVDTEKDGSGTVRAKAWKKADAEPAEWTLEYKHKAAHQNGSPGFFSLSPQEQRAWIDNIEVKAN